MNRSPGQQKPQQATADRRGQADLDTDRVGAEHIGFEEPLNIGKGEVPGLILKCPHHQVGSGQHQEHQGEDQKRQDT